MTTTLELSPQAIQLRDQLQQQRNWQDTYRTLIQAAKSQPQLEPEFHTDDFRVLGCEAKVWLKANHQKNTLSFNFASESRMVYALTYAALLPLQQQSPQAITSFNIEQWLQQCNLIKHLAPSRSNGLYQIIRRAQSIAASA